jgi:hypothetical protein
MKKETYIIFLLPLYALLTTTVESAKITIYNNSNFDIWCVSSKSGKCTSICYNPWTREPINACCGSTDIIKPLTSEILDFKGGHPAYSKVSGVGNLKPVYTITAWDNENGKHWHWQTKDMVWGTQDSSLTFPDDFTMSFADYKKLKHPSTGWAVYPLMASGFFGTITNNTNLTFNVPIGSTGGSFIIPPNAKSFDTSNAFKISGNTAFFGGSSSQQAVWDSKKQIVIQSSPNGISMKIVISFDDIGNTLRIESIITPGQSSGQGGQPSDFTANTSSLNFTTLLSTLNIPQTPTNQIHWWTLSLSISPNNDYKVIVDQLTIRHRYVNTANPDGTTETIKLNNNNLKLRQILFES